MGHLIGTTDKAYISTVSLLDKREILDQVMDVTDEERTILDIMEITGNMTVTEQPEFNHFENEFVFKAGIIASSGVDPETDGSTGKRVSSVNKDVTLLLTNVNQLPAVGEMALFENKVTGFVKSISETDIYVTIEPLSQAAGDEIDTGSDLADDQAVAFHSASSGEGTTSPAGRRSEWVLSKNNIQIFKDSNKITDVQKVATIEVKYGGKYYVLYKLQHDTFLRFRAKIAYGLLANKQSIGTDAAGNKRWTTQGLWNYIKSGDGSTNTTGGYTLALGGSAITKANLLTLNRKLDKARSPKEAWGWVGGDLRAAMDDLFVAMDGLKQGGLQYNSFGKGDAKKRAVDMGVDSTILYGRTMHWKTLDAYDHPQVFGAGTFDYAGSGFIIPTGQIKIDASGNRQNRIMVRYMPVNGQKYFENQFGKLAPRPTDDEAVLGFSYQGICGLQICGVSQFAMITK